MVYKTSTLFIFLLLSVSSIKSNDDPCKPGIDKIKDEAHRFIKDTYKDDWTNMFPNLIMYLKSIVEVIVCYSQTEIKIDRKAIVLEGIDVTRTGSDCVIDHLNKVLVSMRGIPYYFVGGDIPKAVETMYKTISIYNEINNC